MTETTTTTRTRSTRTRTLGRVASTVVALAVGAGAGLGAAGTASAATVHPGAVRTAAAAAPATPAQMQSQFLALLNRHRAANGEKALRVSADLVKVAHGWSATMAAGNDLSHNPDLATQVQNWEVVGENVGDGTDVTTLDTAFWNSPGHRANELYAAFTDVGIAVVMSGTTVWVTYDFRQELNPTPVVTPAQHAAAVRRAAAKKLAAKKHAAAKRAARRRHHTG